MITPADFPPAGINMMCPYRSRVLLLSVCFSGFFSQFAVGETPLHEQIDAVLAKTHLGPAAPLASDAEFLRRVSLDLTGRIPSAAEARRFLDDPAPDKRRRLIDALLQSPACDRHLAKVFDVMFMERRGDKHIKAAEWEAYLLASLQENKPFHVLAREILAADGVDAETRPAAKFYMDRDELAVNLVTRDTARVFFGRDLECAQCHDHPLISDYEQSEYYGLLAFLDRSSIFQPDKKKPAVIAEKAEGTVKFKSVFTGYEGETLPRLPGEEEIEEPTFKKGEEYKVKPAKNVRPVPQYSRREKLAELATAGTNVAFNKNIANRLWAMMLGRGVVDPVDMHHSENPPTSPELLDLLSQQFVAMKFDIKRFLREIALSNTYQRTFRLPDSLEENIHLARQELPTIQTAQTEYQQQAERFQQSWQDSEAALKTHQDALKPIREKAKTLKAQLTAAEKKSQEAKASLGKLEGSLAAKQDVANLLAEAAEQAKLAAEKLPDDQGLAQSRAAIDAQSQSWREQVARLQKQHDQQAAVLKTTQTELAGVRKQSEELQAEQAKRESLIQKAESDIQTARDKKKAAETSAESAGREMARLRLLIHYGDTSHNVESGQAAVKAVQSELAAAQASAAQKADVLALSQQQLADLKNSRGELSEALKSKQEQRAAHTETAGLIEEALTQVESAQKQQPQDQGLAAVTEQLETARDGQTDQQSALGDEVEELKTSLEQSAAEMAEVEKTIAETKTALKNTQKTASALLARQKEAQAELEKAEAAFEQAEIELTESWTKQFRLAGVDHLSPEQLAWSVLQAVGQVELQQKAALAAWGKKNPKLAGQDLSAEQRAERAEFIEQTVQSKLQGQVRKFLPLFAANAGQPQHEFFATVDQALFFANGNDLLTWLRPSGGNLTDRLRQMDEPQQLAEELYLSILTRRPTETEIQDVTDYLDRQDDKDQAIQEMAWALLTSAEFRFEH